MEETAMSWCDGDIPQLKTIKEALELFADNRVIMNKQSAASSGTCQPCDLAAPFKIIRNLLPTHTVRDLPPERCPMRRKVHKAFQSNELKGLKLTNTKKNALIDFIAVLPSILSKAFNIPNIQKGCLEAGIIDKIARRYPTCNGILATCKRNPNIDEYLNAIQTCRSNIKYCNDFGGVDDVAHDENGVRKDMNEHGEVVEKKASIRQEHMQRSKCMNHHYVCKERNAEARKHCQSKLSRMMGDNAKHMTKVDDNREAVNIVLKAAQQSGHLEDGAVLSDDIYLKSCQLEHFDVLRAPQLKAFIVKRLRYYNKYF